MKVYKIVKIENTLYSSKLAKIAEEKVNALVTEGWEILNVSFGPSGMGFSAFITIYR
jgi:hypothetical protein